MGPDHEASVWIRAPILKDWCVRVAPGVQVSVEVQTEDVMALWKGLLIALAGVLMQWAVEASAMGIAKMDVTFWAWVLGMGKMGLLNLVPVRKTDGAGQ